ncbi:MAG TPA: multicopper oxidase domain-containing protein [Candidatus Binatia bacterium]|nr:multicopper oxidase domain-containing protein [Candidatus Binatia bacterium]
MRKPHQVWLPILLVGLVTGVARAQSFRVQCPSSTISHPAATNDSEPAYTGPTTFAHCTPGSAIPGSSVLCPSSGVYPMNVNGAIKCQQISGGDGYSTMADGTQTYMFSFGPLSGLSDIANGQPGTEPPSTFNSTYPGTRLLPGDPATTDGASDGGGYVPGVLGTFNWNGAVGLIGDPDSTVPNPSGTQAAATAVVAGGIIEDVTITNPGSGYNGPVTVTFSAPACTPSPSCETALGTVTVANGQVTGVNINFAGEGYTTTPSVTISAPVIGCTNSSLSGCLDGHVDPRQIMDIGVMNGNIPAPLIAIDEDDEFFLTLTNVGMIMRPDLFEQHTVHFHGYPNASSFYDGVPDASVAINIGGSFTYYYLAPDAGTYFWHCHITPPEHLQMGMVGQLYVRPRQNRVPGTTSLYAGLQTQQLDNRTKCDSTQDILCSNPLPAVNTGAMGGGKYAYNDGDGTTRYDVEYPIQIHGFDPNFHFVGMTFNPEGFSDMKDKYFLLNGRSYPDTVAAGPQATMSADGAMHYSQPLNAIINIPAGGKALLRISDLDVSEYQTLASLGIPMTVIGYNAKLLRDQEGNNLYYMTNSITLGGGESLDVILDASNTALYPKGSVFFLYTPNLDHLSNDAENFGGLMTEVHIN